MASDQIISVEDGPKTEKGSNSQTFILEKEKELRCEVTPESSLSVKLVSGTAEIFGTEIAIGECVEFQGGQKFAVFTWHGATIDVEGQADMLYVPEGTPMVTYLNVHGILNARRKEALEAINQNKEAQGPRVMVVGPTDSGKSSLLHILLAYAARLGWKPTYADLDITQGDLALPGTITAASIDSPIDSYLTVSHDAPLVYYFGHITPNSYPELYKALVRQLGSVLNSHLVSNAKIRASGLFINTMGWVEGLGYELLLDSIDTLNVDVILVLGQERLYTLLQAVFQEKPNVEVVNLPKSGGVVSRNSKHRTNARQLKTKEYFYGVSNELKPHSQISSFSDYQVFRIGGNPQAPKSALPIGTEPSTDPTKPVSISITTDLVHALLAVSYATNVDEILTSNVAGFVYVTNVDIASQKITYVTPNPGKLPGNFLLAGSIASVDS